MSSRRRNALVLFAAEGRNATETLYLKDVFKDKDGLVLRKAYGTDTDPVGMVKNLVATMDDLGFDSDYGDLAFCFIDLDCSKDKEKQIMEVVKKSTGSNIYLIISNPCFELWYMCHFTSSPRNYAGSKDLLKDMPKYIKDYGKSKEGIYAILKDKTEVAIINAKNLEERAKEKGYKHHTADFSPATDVYQIFQLIEGAGKKKN